AGELTQRATFAGFDFEGVWNIDVGGTPYFGNQSPFVTITGDEGWRMLSIPVQGATYAEIFDPIWTQCIPGSDSPNHGTPNLYYWDEPTQDWQVPASMLETVSIGTGVI